MKINKTHDISGYQKLMHTMCDQCLGDNNQIVSMCIKSKNLVESKLADLRQKRDSLNSLIGEYKAKADYAHYLIRELMRANDLTEAGEGDHTVKRMKAGKPAIVELSPEAAHMVPQGYTKTVVTLDKKLILEHIKENDYVVPDEFKDAIKIEWRDRLKFSGEKDD